jgi:hypothetical protein
MILSKITQATQFLPSLNLDLNNERFTDFFRRAQEWLVSHVIGNGLETVLETEVGMTATDSHPDLRLLCQRIIAEKGLLDAIPEMDMQLTEAGFAVQNNDQFTPASSQRVDRLMAKLPERIASDVDSLVRFLMKNSDGTTNNPKPYDSWRGTDQFLHLTAAFIPFFESYNRLALAPAKSYEEFYNAIPTMAREMSKVADYYVSSKEVCRLRELYRDGETLEIHRKAIAELKSVAVAAYCCDGQRARDAAASAREIMLSDSDNFPMFKESDAFNKPSVNIDAGQLVNML